VPQETVCEEIKQEGLVDFYIGAHNVKFFYENGEVNTLAKTSVNVHLYEEQSREENKWFPLKKELNYKDVSLHEFLNKTSGKKSARFYGFAATEKMMTRKITIDNCL
jgi:hypothetical protein